MRSASKMGVRILYRIAAITSCREIEKKLREKKVGDCVFNLKWLETSGKYAHCPFWTLVCFNGPKVIKIRENQRTKAWITTKFSYKNMAFSLQFQKPRVEKSISKEKSNKNNKCFGGEKEYSNVD